jgi:hypothetical protein
MWLFLHHIYRVIHSEEHRINNYKSRNNSATEMKIGEYIHWKIEDNWVTEDLEYWFPST